MVNKWVETRDKVRNKVVAVELEIKGFLNLHDMCTEYLDKTVNGSLLIYMVGFVRRGMYGEYQSISVG